VAAAHGWTDWRADLPDDEILLRLLAPSREHAGKQHKSATLLLVTRSRTA